MSTKQIIKLNASALKESACSRRLYLTVVEGYKEQLNFNDIEYGSAFHEFVKVMRQQPERYDLAVAAAQKRYSVPMRFKDNKSYMNETHLLNTCMSFWQQWVAKDSYTTVVHSGKPLVELQFCIPYYADDEVEVQLCGTIDDICKHQHGTYAFRDYKTTSVYKTDEYLASYELSPQLMFYRLAIDYYSRAYPASVFAEINKYENIACFIDAIFLRGAKAPPEFKRSRVFVFSKHQLDEFERQLRVAVLELVKLVKAKVMPDRQGMINNACQTPYGTCKFANACRQLDETAFRHVLNNHFKQETYDPLSH